MAGGYTCVKCLSFATDVSEQAELPPCEGSKLMTGLRNGSVHLGQRHKLFAAKLDRSRYLGKSTCRSNIVIFCSECWLYAEDHIRDLRHDCKPPSARAPTNKRCFRSGVHPVEKGTLVGKPVRFHTLLDLNVLRHAALGPFIPDDREEHDAGAGRKAAGLECVVGDTIEFPEDLDSLLRSPAAPCCAASLPLLPMDDPEQIGLG